MTAGGYPALQHCASVFVCERQGKKSWLRAVVMCSVVVFSRWDPACVLKSKITCSLSVLVRAKEHLLSRGTNTEDATPKETTEMLGNGY